MCGCDSGAWLASRLSSGHRKTRQRREARRRVGVKVESDHGQRHRVCMAGLLSLLLCEKAQAVCWYRNVIVRALKQKTAAMRVRDGF